MVSNESKRLLNRYHYRIFEGSLNLSVPQIAIAQNGSKDPWMGFASDTFEEDVAGFLALPKVKQKIARTSWLLKLDTDPKRLLISFLKEGLLSDITLEVCARKGHHSFYLSSPALDSLLDTFLEIRKISDPRKGHGRWWAEGWSVVTSQNQVWISIRSQNELKAFVQEAQPKAIHFPEELFKQQKEVFSRLQNNLEGQKKGIEKQLEKLEVEKDSQESMYRYLNQLY